MHAFILLSLTCPIWLLAEPEAPAPKADAGPKGVQQLTPTLSVDYDNKVVRLDAEVVLRAGMLELLLCPKRSKEHESILAAEVHPQHFHLALLLIGAQPGRPASHNPFQPPTGQQLKIWLEYEMDGQKKTVDAREWIRNTKTKKALESDFVFAGSRFTQAPGVDTPVYLGNDGDLVCVVNFPGSVIDINTQASTDNTELFFEAWTEKIPPKGTKVRVIFEPVKNPS